MIEFPARKLQVHIQGKGNFTQKQDSQNTQQGDRTSGLAPDREKCLAEPVASFDYLRTWMLRKALLQNQSASAGNNEQTTRNSDRWG